MSKVKFYFNVHSYFFSTLSIKKDGWYRKDRYQCQYNLQPILLTATDKECQARRACQFNHFIPDKG